MKNFEKNSDPNVGGMSRRDFMRNMAAMGISAYGLSLPAKYRKNVLVDAPQAKSKCFTNRIAFDIWLNDERTDPNPVAPWPNPVFDDLTVSSIIRAMDIQAQAGYQYVDLAGLFNTDAWPLNIEGSVTAERQARIHKILDAAHSRGLKVTVFPSGIMNWGFNTIIQNDPAVRGNNWPNWPANCNMCPSQSKSWEYMYRIYDYVMDNFNFDGFHFESADQGRCQCSICNDRWPVGPMDAAYHAYVNAQAANYVKNKNSKMYIFMTTWGWIPKGAFFTASDKDQLVQLSHNVDCIFNQGHYGPYIPYADLSGFIDRISCDFGTSGGTWFYPPPQLQRQRWFLPYTMRVGTHIKRLYSLGGRAGLIYQGAVNNPSTEVNIFCAGRQMADTTKSLSEILAESLEELYRPKNAVVLKKLVDIFQRAENGYFGPIPSDPDKVDAGERYFGNFDAPTVAYLGDCAQLPAYKKELQSFLVELAAIKNDFKDNGRIAAIQTSINGVLADMPI